ELWSADTVVRASGKVDQKEDRIILLVDDVVKIES
ncbi:MAG: hypothetical protein UY16_C0027G0001, partial [Candidatus Gottesmanbacteria bacterium GW2011_GWA2_47_9]